MIHMGKFNRWFGSAFDLNFQTPVFFHALHISQAHDHKIQRIIMPKNLWMEKKNK